MRALYCQKCFGMLTSSGECPRCGHSAADVKLWPAVLASMFLSGFIATIVLKLWNLQVGYPLAYQGDALMYDLYIKTIIDNGWYLTNKDLGMPFGTSFHEFPFNDLVFMSCIKLISLFSNSVFIVSNVAFLITFPLVAATSTFVMVRLGLNRPFSVAGALLYTFLPFHLMRGLNHLNFSYYFMIPIGIYLCLNLFNPLQLECNARKIGVSFTGIIFAVLLGVTTEYYAFYTCFLLLTAGIASWFYQRKFVCFLNSTVIVSIISAVFILSLLPSILYISEEGRNPYVATRSVHESERYALKISQMLLPVRGHRIDAAQRISKYYHENSIPSSGESSMSALGVIGTTGFIVLCLIIINRKNEFDNGNLLGQLSVLNIAAVLYGTVGGFSALFSLIVTPLLRAHARISIFIGFMVMVALFAIIQRYLVARQLNNMTITIAVAALLSAIGIYDQSTLLNVPKYSEIKFNYDSDVAFVRSIEKSLSRNAMVFQLPFCKFPEEGKKFNLGDYELGKPYLHSTKLRWSYGAIIGRKSGDWQKAVTEKPPEDFVNEIKAAGFSGIYIDRRGYADSGVEIESKLRAILRAKPIVSNNGNNSFFVL